LTSKFQFGDLSGIGLDLEVILEEANVPAGVFADCSRNGIGAFVVLEGHQRRDYGVDFRKRFFRRFQCLQHLRPLYHAFVVFGLQLERQQTEIEVTKLLIFEVMPRVAGPINDPCHRTRNQVIWSSSVPKRAA